MTSLHFPAYLQPITRAITESSAQAIAFWTWGLFLASNASAIGYAVNDKEDWSMAFKLVMPVAAGRSCRLGLC
jgi:hypothetical protein